MPEGGNIPPGPKRLIGDADLDERFVVAVESIAGSLALLAALATSAAEEAPPGA